MKNKAKALKAIEYLTGGDWAADLEYDVALGIVKDKRLITAERIISQIYKISHSEGKCNHRDWEEEKEKVLKVYKNL